MQSSRNDTNDLLFGFYRPQFDHRMMVSSLTGGQLPKSAEMRIAGGDDRSIRLTSGDDLTISGGSFQDAQIELVRALAFGFYPLHIEPEGFSDNEAFEGILASRGGEINVTRKSIVVELLIPSLFYLPLFQHSILKAAHDSLSGQPFLTPLETHQLKLAESTRLQSGDYIVVQYAGTPSCLALKSKKNDEFYYADLFVATGSLNMEGDNMLTSKVVSSIGITSFSFSAEIAKVCRSSD